MRTLPLCLALVLASCTAGNPLFGLDPTDAASSTAAASTSAATVTPTSEDPTAAPTSAPATSVDTTDPGGSLTDTGEPASTSGVDPGTTTGTSDTSNSTSDGTTGDVGCKLHKNDKFDGRMYVDGAPAKLCGDEISYYIGNLLMSGDELLFATGEDSQCPGKSNKGNLSIGVGYQLPVATPGVCAKLAVLRDGDGPDCDIAHFVIYNNPVVFAGGTFTTAKAPPANMIAVPQELAIPCCPDEAQDCCADNFGDFALQFPQNQKPIAPGERVDGVPIESGTASVINIQAWDSAICGNPLQPTGAHDWAGVRTLP